MKTQQNHIKSSILHHSKSINSQFEMILQHKKPCLLAGYLEFLSWNTFYSYLNGLTATTALSYQLELITVCPIERFSSPLPGLMMLATDDQPAVYVCTSTWFSTTTSHYGTHIAPLNPPLSLLHTSHRLYGDETLITEIAFCQHPFCSLLPWWSKEGMMIWLRSRNPHNFSPCSHFTT